MTKKKIFSLLVKLLVSIAILVFLYFKADFNTDGFWRIISGINLPIYLFSLFGVIIVLGIKSYRWKLLVANEGYNYKAYRSFGAYMSSDAIGIVTPGRIGEIARLYYVRQETDISFLQAFKTIVADRIFDFTMLGWFGISGMTFYFHIFGALPGYLYALIVLLVIVAGYIILLASLRKMINLNWFRRWQIPGFIYECFLAVLGKKTILMWAITILAYFSYFLFSWFIMLSLNVRPGIVDIAFIMSIMSLSTIIPISVAGFGTREATLVMLFAQYGFSSEVAISFSLLHFTAFFFWGGLIGLVYWLIMPISLQQVKDDSIQIFSLLKRTGKETIKD
jgi:glycosyltransferase 2 family protein